MPARRALLGWGVVFVVAFLVTAVAVPAPFTMDEDHYLVTALAAEAGRLSVPGTGGLSPSRELRYFCPEAPFVPVDRTPVYARVPPLYGFIALPFLGAGWYGLVFINALSFTAMAFLVYRHLKREGLGRQAPLVGLAAVTLGAFFFEYAVGLWPQMLSVLLTFGGYLMTRRALESKWSVAAAAGFITGLSVGVRYQNSLFVGVFLGTILLFAPTRRLKKSLGFLGGAALPLLLNSLINVVRFHTPNPISKGNGYLSVPLLSNGPAKGNGLLDRLSDIAALFWARLVDFSVRPEGHLLHTHGYLHRDGASGAYLAGDALKKSLMQSSPWIGLAVVCLVAACLSRRHRSPFVQELRMIACCVFPILLVFAVAGPERTDGFCFNQRYLLELVPLFAVALAIGMSRFNIHPVGALAGGAAVIVSMLLVHPIPAAEPVLFSVIPIGIGLLLIGAWSLQTVKTTPRLLGVLLGAAIGWALFVHLYDDFDADRRHRALHLMAARLADAHLPNRAALFAYRWRGVSFGVLQMDRDLVIVDPYADHGETAGLLARELKHQGRRIFVYPPGMPQKTMDAIIEGASGHGQPPIPRGKLLLEIR